MNANKKVVNNSAANSKASHYTNILRNKIADCAVLKESNDSSYVRMSLHVENRKRRTLPCGVHWVLWTPGYFSRKTHLGWPKVNMRLRAMHNLCFGSEHNLTKLFSNIISESVISLYFEDHDIRRAADASTREFAPGIVMEYVRQY